MFNINVISSKISQLLQQIEKYNRDRKAEIIQ